MVSAAVPYARGLGFESRSARYFIFNVFYLKILKNIVIKFRLLDVHSVKNVYVLNIFILLIIIMNWFKFIFVLASKDVLEYRFAELFQK